MSCPPACNPSITRGERLARAVYTAAVRPAGPDPMMITFRALMNVALVVVAARRSRVALGETEPAGGQEDSAQGEPSGEYVALIDENEATERAGRQDHERGRNDERGQQAE